MDISTFADIAFYKVFPIAGVILSLGSLMICTTAKEW